MRHSYQMKFQLMDSPYWWQNFVNSFDEDEIAYSNILHTTLKSQYNATLHRVNDSLFILQFDNDEDHMMFMMQWK